MKYLVKIGGENRSEKEMWLGCSTAKGGEERERRGRRDQRFRFGLE